METLAAQAGTTDVYIAASCDGGRTFSAQYGRGVARRRMVPGLDHEARKALARISNAELSRTL
jgi:hypothetical protein